MGKPQLYLLVGYPGSGKTTISRIIHEVTGATHIWTDWERRTMFGQPTHSASENNKLYDYLNTLTGQLLRDGKSVIFDTNFNFRKDRQHLSEIATAAGAETVIIWLTTSQALSKKRAVHIGSIRNGYETTMSAAEFDRIASHLEEPGENEKIIKINGTKLDDKRVKQILGL